MIHTIHTLKNYDRVPPYFLQDSSELFSHGWFRIVQPWIVQNCSAIDSSDNSAINTLRVPYYFLQKLEIIGQLITCYTTTIINKNSEYYSE